MNALRVTAAVALSLALTPGHAAAQPATDVREREENNWPGIVRQFDAHGRTQSLSAAGPLVFRKPDAEGGTVSGVRPFWLQTHDERGNFRAGHFLYPLFSYTVDENTYKWSVFELIRSWGRLRDAPAPTSTFEQIAEFEVFPFWFSREAGDAELSYRGLFPIYGTVKNKLTFERLSWTLFPLYVENEKRGAVTTSTPWPIVRVTRGAAHGWGVWPLFNYVERPGVSREEYYLWPLGFNATRQPHPDDPPGTPVRRDVGALPFWSRSTGPGYFNEDYLWPFFGTTEIDRHPAREKQRRYRERRYFWPFLVQGRGEERFVDRWAPFYTHSVTRGYDKTWYLWPLVRRAQWIDSDVTRDRTQFLYLLYWSERQRPVARVSQPVDSPNTGQETRATPQTRAPSEARLTHVWPLFSHWDNGAGREQWQALSPFEVLFPGNEKARHAWSPLFALARHEQHSPGHSRTSLLWDAITWEKFAPQERTELHIGPLLSVAGDPDRKRIAIGNGLFGWKRATAGGAWEFFWLDFSRRSATTSAPR